MKNILLIFLIILLSGCTTLTLSQGPDTVSLKSYNNAPSLGVIKVADDRSSQNIGTIGASGIKVKKEDLRNLTTNYLIDYLNTKLQANVIQVTEEPNQDFVHIASKNKLDRIIVSKIADVRMFSIDSLMQPVETDIDIDVSVYDSQGIKLYANTLSGHYEKRLGFIASNKNIGTFVEFAVKEAMNNLVQDETFAKAIQINN